MDLRVWVQDPGGGDSWALLPDVQEVTITVPADATPTLDLTYPEGGEYASALIRETILVVEVSHDGQEWLEPPGVRFTVTGSEWHPLGDGTTTYKVSALHISDRLADAIVWNSGALHKIQDVSSCVSTTGKAGALMRSLWDTAASRGWGQGLAIRGDLTADADGTPWRDTPGVSGMTIRWTETLAAVADQLRDMGGLDITWRGGTMEMRAPRPKQVLTGVVWHLSTQATEAEERTSWADMATHVHVLGAEGKHWVLAVPGLPPGYRRREVSLEASTVTTEAGARAAAAEILVRGQGAAEQITHDWDAAAAELLPWRDYTPGDWIRAQRYGDVYEDLRVAQVSVTKSDDGRVIGHTTLGTTIDSAVARLARRSRAVTPGSAATSSTSAVVPQQSGQTPDVIVAHTVSATSTVEETADGGLAATIDASWPAVTRDSAGQPLARPVREYEVWVGRIAKGGAEQQVMSVRVSRNAFSWPYATVGDTYTIWVRAIGDEGDAARWPAAPARVTAEWTPQPPPRPSRPKVTSSLGVVTVSWDGRLEDGRPAGGRVDSWEVSTRVEDGQPVVTGARAGREKGDLQAPAMAGQEVPVVIRLRTVDGLAGPWSDPPVLHRVESAVDMEDLLRRLKEGGELTKAARDAARTEISHTQEAQRLVAAALSGSDYPPDEGEPGVTRWIAPDGRVFVMESRHQ